MSQPQDSNGAPPPDEVTFNTGCMGCMVMILMLGAGMFGIAAFDGAFYAEITDGPRPRNNWLGALGVFRVGDVNIAVLLLVGYIVFETIRIGRKFVDPRAAWIDGDRIRFHRSLRLDPVSLAGLVDIRHETGAGRSVLVMRLAGGRLVEVAMVDHDAAIAFIAEVKRRRA